MSSSAEEDKQPQENDENNKTMTPDERMAYLRERGVEISTPEDRSGGKGTATATTNQNSVSYVLIPADTSQPLQELSFSPPAKSEEFVDDLQEHLKQAFSSSSDKVDISLLNKANTSTVLGGQNLPPVSDEAFLKTAAEGHVEVFALVYPTASNNYTTTNIYLDEVGMLKRLPLNARASQYALQAGYNPPPQFYGDVFLGRKQRQKYLSIQVGQDTAMDAPWLQQAKMTNMEFQVAKNKLTGQVGETQPNVAGQDGQEKLEEGYSWTQTEEEVEIVVALPEEATAKLIKVQFKPQSVKVDYQSTSKVTLTTFQKIDVDSGTWTLEKDGDNKKLVITVEKADEGLWPRIEN